MPIDPQANKSTQEESDPDHQKTDSRQALVRERSVHSPGDAAAQKHRQGSDGTQAGDPVVLDVAEWL